MDTTTTLNTFRYNPPCNVNFCRGSADFSGSKRTAIMTTTASGKIFPLWICYFLWSITCVCLPLFGLLKSNAVIIWTNACSSKRRVECLTIFHIIYVRFLSLLISFFTSCSSHNLRPPVLRKVLSFFTIPTNNDMTSLKKRRYGLMKYALNSLHCNKLVSLHCGATLDRRFNNKFKLHSRKWLGANGCWTLWLVIEWCESNLLVKTTDISAA